ncbi:hypothetical protein BGZ81_006423 [Podila clonocystis]|nr:hypothetical protein BGZ81_006423 [Podila clonocystis]
MHEEDHSSTSTPYRHDTLTTHENRSNRQVHLLSNNQQATVYLSGNGPNQNNRSNPSNVNLALNSDYHQDSAEARLIRSRSSPNPDVPVIIELSTLPPIHPSQSTAGKRAYPKQVHRLSNNREMFSNRDSSMHDLRIDDMGQSHLPRPLHMQRPVIADMNISPSTKVVANIIRAPSPSGSFMRRSPSPGLRVVASGPDVPSIPPTKHETQRPRKPSKPDPVAPTLPVRDACTKLNTQPADTDPDLVTLPVYETGGDPFISKEELRNGPQALLTANLHNLVDPASSQPVATESSKNQNLLITEEVELTTAHLVLMPYLQVQPESSPPLPSPVAVASESAFTVAPKVQTSPPLTPEKSPKRNSFRRNEGDQQQQQQHGSPLASIQESAPITVTSQKPNYAQHHPHPPPIATKINSGVASTLGNTSTPPAPPSSRKTPTRPGLHGRESSSSSVGSPTSTLVATPTSATTPRSPPVPATPPPVPVPPLAYAYAAEVARAQVADAARTASPSPSNTSSNISSGFSIISSIYSTAPSSGVSGSPVGSTTNVSCTASPTIYSPKIYSPTTPGSTNGGVDSAVIRNHAGSYYHDDFLKKYNPPTGIIQKYVDGGEEEETEEGRQRRDTLVTEQDGESDDGSGWLYKAASRGNEKRMNHPQAPDGAGTRFSQFNFQNE